MSVSLLGLVCFGTMILLFGLGLVAAIKMIGGSVVRMARDEPVDPGWWRAVVITTGLVLLAGMIFGTSWRSEGTLSQTVSPRVPGTISQIPDPPMAPRVAMAPVGVLLGVVLVAVVVLTFSVVWTISRPHAPSPAVPTSHRKVYGLGSALTLLLLAGGGLLLFGFSIVRYRAAAVRQVVIQSGEAEWPILAAEPRTAAIETLPDGSTVQVSIEAPASAESPMNTVVEVTQPSPLPDWVQAGDTTEDGAQLRVLSSGQYATDQEARADVDEQARALIKSDLDRYSHVWLATRQSALEQSSIPAAVRQQHVQVERRQFTSFSAPMYRVWYQVELSPRVREASLVRIKAQQLEGRTLAVAAGFGALLLVPLAILLAGAISRALGGLAYEFTLGTALTSVLLAWGAGAWLLNQYVVLWG